MADKVAGDRGEPETRVENVAVTDPAEVKDEFVEAYAEASAIPGDNADLSAADNPENVQDTEEKVEEKVITPASVPSPVTPAAATPPITPDPNSPIQQPGETDEKYEQRYKTLQGIHKHDKETWESERTQLLHDLEEAKKPRTPEPVTPKTPTKTETEAADAFIDSLTDEQKKQLEDYEKDFDVVSKMEGIKRKKALSELRKEMMDTLETWKTEFTTKLADTSTQITSRIAPAIKLAEDSDQESHFAMIRDGYTAEDGTVVPGHSDFTKYRDDGSLRAWIDAKPRYMQPALKAAYEGGTAMDVIDLISDFKRDNNIPLIPIASDNVIPITPSNPAKEAKKAALTTVTNRRGAVNTNLAVADDYEGAFDEAQNK